MFVERTVAECELDRKYVRAKMCEGEVACDGLVAEESLVEESLLKGYFRVGTALSSTGADYSGVIL